MRSAWGGVGEAPRIMYNDPQLRPGMGGSRRSSAHHTPRPRQGRSAGASALRSPSRRRNAPIGHGPPGPGQMAPPPRSITKGQDLFADRLYNSSEHPALTCAIPGPKSKVSSAPFAKALATGALWTRGRMQQCGYQVDDRCPLCGEYPG